MVKKTPYHYFKYANYYCCDLCYNNYWPMMSVLFLFLNYFEIIMIIVLDYFVVTIIIIITNHIIIDFTAIITKIVIDELNLKTL